ncbi:MAG: class I SAM-dependent RNA methyltransferase, partial [Myxococcales bacterium]|nr:class I SAM-dependent RNA methyltransferase [Myxococcales bacterium]
MGRRPGSARGSRGRDEVSLELAVGSLADTGEGSAVGPDGARWLVPGALPGETVRAVPEGARRARLLAVLVPSGARVEPACPVARVCGGCDLMHLALPEQQAFHARRLAELCGRTLGRAAVPEPRVLAPGAALGYRSRARLHVRADARGVVLGYRAPRSHAHVPVRACAVLEPALEPAFAELAALLAGARGTGEVALARGARGARVY